MNTKQLFLITLLVSPASTLASDDYAYTRLVLLGIGCFHLGLLYHHIKCLRQENADLRATLNRLNGVASPNHPQELATRDDINAFRTNLLDATEKIDALYAYFVPPRTETNDNPFMPTPPDYWRDLGETVSNPEAPGHIEASASPQQQRRRNFLGILFPIRGSRS